VSRLQFLLRIELDDDSRVSCAECQHTFGLTVLTADTTDYEWTRATDAHVIVNGIRLPCTARERRNARRSTVA
jgi:hypothetical protein